MVISKKTAQIVESTGKKIKVDYAEFHRGPKTCQSRSLLVRDIGVAVRVNVPMLASSFLNLEEEQKLEVKIYLERYYDIPGSDTDMWNFIYQKAGERFRDWKYDCHLHFEEHGAALPKEFLDRPRQWDYLVNHEFMAEKKRAQSACNKRNRNTNEGKLNHHSGAKAFSYRAEELLLAGHPAPRCAAALEVYEQCENGGEKIQNLKRKIFEVEQQAAQNGQEDRPVIPLEDESEILISTLGEGKGTLIKGMGAAVQRPPKKRGGPQIVSEANERATLAEEKAALAEEKAALAEEKAALAEERAALAEERAAQADERAAQADERATQADGRATQAAGTANEAKEVAQKASENGEKLKELFLSYMAGGSQASTKGQ